MHMNPSLRFLRWYLLLQTFDFYVYDKGMLVAEMSNSSSVTLTDPEFV